MRNEDIYYSVGSIETYIYPFKIDDVKFQEYIHCEVIEHLQTDRDGRPEKIKVNHIHDLESYLRGQKENVSERILELYKIQPYLSLKRKNHYGD